MGTTPLAAAETGPWASGWDMLVALGTLGLAAVTVWLAWSTRQLARETAADQRAQWRPVVLPAGDWQRGQAQRDRSTNYFGTGRHAILRVRVWNSGRGPALHVRVQLERAGQPGADRPVNWSLGALAPGEAASLRFEEVAFPERAQLLIDYRDMTGRSHAKASTIVRDGQDAYVYDVQVFEDHAVSTLGDAVYPQAGLRDVRPLTSPPGTRISLGKKKETA
ncbi:hypothetical protein [Streptomyces sp. NPDC001401]|uniref:hypothetical protein n=1 Tax=Streptomyces sp. NPDC001401 TaxID=3364570 RepID=UPI00368FCADE